MDCSQLTTGLVAAQCNVSATNGAEDDVYLFNYSDIDRVASTISNNIISNLALVGNTTVGYKFQTFGRSLNDSGVTFTKGTYRNTVLQNIWLRIFVKSEYAKEFVNDFINGVKIVAVIVNKDGGTNGRVKYEAYGWDNGLELNELSATLEMTDGVVYPLNVGSSDTAQEASLPKTVFTSSLEATKTMLESLLEPRT
jgi:hypothetical protein